jgi:hypothetical protein
MSKDGRVGASKQRRGLGRLALGAAIAVLFLVAAASMPKIFPFLRGSGEARLVRPDTPAVADVLLVVLALTIVATAVVVQFTVRRGSYVTPLSRRRPVWAQLLIVVVVIWATALAVSLLDRRDERASQPTPEATSGPAEALRSDEERESSRALGLLVTAGLLILVAGSGSLLYLIVRQDRARPPRVEEAHELGEELRASARRVQEATDPRSAVIACFERLELKFLERGVERRPSDTPFELIERALLRLAVPEAAVRRLASLFELARFSEREIDDYMRGEAVDALSEVASSLEGAG